MLPVSSMVIDENLSNTNISMTANGVTEKMGRMNLNQLAFGGNLAASGGSGIPKSSGT